jgi:FdrA protein
VGISQGIGTGGRDLKKEVGGIMMLLALQALQQDPATTVLALISKPPAQEVARAVLHQASACSKPTVVCFLGGEMDALDKSSNVIPARTLQECSLLAARAVHSGTDDLPAAIQNENTLLAQRASELKRGLDRRQRSLRGLFSGGTLCYEAQVVWEDMQVSPVNSNAPLPGGTALPDSTRSLGHTAVDLGEEEFTVGRPHPMIDNDLRIRRLLQEARDPETAVIMLDVVLGYGAHPDPASELGQAIRQARGLARMDGRTLPVVASVTGTQDDPQGLQHTISSLQAAGADVCDSNAAAARLTGMIVSA